MPEAPGPDEPPTAVFVYGTLRPGRTNWPVAEPFCAGHEPATLPGHGLYALAYPVVAPLPPDPADRSTEDPGVRGELLWLVPDQVGAALHRLDAFEGVDPVRPDRSYYRRTRALVSTSGGDRHQAWVYVPGDALQAEVHEARRVPGDDWPA